MTTRLGFKTEPPNPNHRLVVAFVEVIGKAGLHEYNESIREKRTKQSTHLKVLVTSSYFCQPC